MNAEQEIVWKCSNCNKYYLTLSAAEDCCKNSEYTEPKKVCADCGVELPKNLYYTVCDNCREKRRYNKCRKMTIEEYEKEFPEHMVIFGYDNFYESVEDALESNYGHDEDVPHYLYGTKKTYATIDIDSAVEQALEDAYEGAEFNNLNELYEFVEKWNEKNKILMFEEAKIVIDIPEEIRKEFIIGD